MYSAFLCADLGYGRLFYCGIGWLIADMGTHMSIVAMLHEFPS
jgi:hypothetical protein